MLSDLITPQSPQTSEPAAPIEALRTMIRKSRVPDVRFAGLGTSNARNIVYVVDASGSMVSVFPQVIDELESSLRKLDPIQHFQVILFGPGANGSLAAPVPGAEVARPARPPRLLRATQRNVTSVLRWARSVLPGKSSNPIEALRAAIALDPDAIFVLSSTITGLGQWDPDKEQLLSELDRMNPRDPRTGRRRVVIKAIQLLEPDPSGILRLLAREHGGENGYNFISRQELLAR